MVVRTRAALYQALTARPDGLRYDDLPKAIVAASGLTPADYAIDPDARYADAENATGPSRTSSPIGRTATWGTGTG